MAKDYKHRVGAKTNALPKPKFLGTWQSVLIAALLVAFGLFLLYLRITAPEEKVVAEPPPASQPKSDKTSSEGKKPADDKKKPAQTDKKPAEGKTKPKFTFYTALQDKEIVVPDYELKALAREQRIGKAEEAQYAIQVGAYKTHKEADQIRAKLALLGIASKVDKVSEEGTVAHRVILGPYAQMKTINDVRLHLKALGANAKVYKIASKSPPSEPKTKPQTPR